MPTAFALHYQPLVERCLGAPDVLPVVSVLPSSSSPPLSVLYLIVTMLVCNACHHHCHHCHFLCIVIIIDYGFSSSPPLCMCTHLIVAMLLCPCLLPPLWSTGAGPLPCIGPPLFGLLPIVMPHLFSGAVASYPSMLVFVLLLITRHLPSADPRTMLGYPV
jgi:hypothetical protein